MSSGPRRWWVAGTTITGEGRRIRRNLQTLLATLLVVAVVGWALVEFGRSQTGTGPNGSLFVTDVNGTAAMSELLSERGHDVIPAVTPLTDLDDGGSLMILDPGFRAEFGDDELRSISDWVAAGGRLIVSGRPHPDLVGAVLPADLRLGFSGQSRAQIVTPIRGIDGEVVTEGVYSIDTEAAMLPLAGDPPVAAAFERGDGVIVFIADGSILWNASLDENAPWIISLIPDGPVRFDEVRHGFTADPATESPTGLLAALPENVRNVVVLLIPVLVLTLVAYGRRFGPPEETERHLAPPRRELVDAVAGLMTRMPDRAEAAALVPERLREMVARKAGLPADTADQKLVEAARELGIEPDHLEASLNARDEDTMLAAQRMLAELSGRENP